MSINGNETHSQNLRVGSAWSIPGIYSENGDCVVGARYNVHIGNNGDNKSMLIDHDGNVTIKGNLTVAGRINCSNINGINIQDNGNIELSRPGHYWNLQSDTNLCHYGDGGTRCWCDRRIKKNIKTADSNEIISKIMTTMSLEYDLGFIGSFHGNTSSRQ